MSANTIQSFHLPPYHEIPDVGLYLDQVTRYINDSLQPLGQPPVTSSMLSNYVKKGAGSASGTHPYAVHDPAGQLYSGKRL